MNATRLRLHSTPAPAGPRPTLHRRESHRDATAPTTYALRQCPQHRSPLITLVALLCCVCASSAPSAATAGGERPTFTVPTEDLSPAMFRLQVRRALGLAWRQLEHQPTCRKLFSDLGADGQQLLTEAEFMRAEKTPYAHICSRRLGVMGTEVGGQTIGICVDGFQRLDRHHAAALMLHEVLHHAGMREFPHDPNALTSREITTLVKQECDL